MFIRDLSKSVEKVFQIRVMDDSIFDTVGQILILEYTLFELFSFVTASRKDMDTSFPFNQRYIPSILKAKDNPFRQYLIASMGF